MKALGIVLFLFLSQNSFAASQPVTTEKMKTILQTALKDRKPISDFWKEVSQTYGVNALPPLFTMLKNEKEADELRWVSLFGVARIAGKRSYKTLAEYSTHKSWLLRDASLRAMAALNAVELRNYIESALNDKALVVRTTAVDVIGHLKLKASLPKLEAALKNPLNYKNEKPLWIHDHIFSVFKELEYKEASSALVELLETRKDPTLRKKVVMTLESLTGKSFPDKSIDEQVFLWKRSTLEDKVF